MTAVSVLLGCVTAGLIGYVIARQWPARPAAPAAEAPPAIAPRPGSAGRHPSFDCRAFVGPLDPPAGAPDTPIASLRRTPAGARVRTRGRVMAAWPHIMGHNWLHLCDAPAGDVLVVATLDWAHPGDAVIVEGPLARDRDIGGIYTFPLLIEGGRLEGPGVIDPPPPGGPAIDL